MNYTPKILYISSANFSEGPGAIGWLHVKSLQEAGFDVDVLTLYRQPEHLDFIYLKRNKTFFDRFVQKVKNIFRLRRPEAPYMFFYKK